MKHKNFVDVKVTLWNRYLFNDNADMKKVADLIQQKGVGWIADEEWGFVEHETLPDSEELLSPQENKGLATIEVYEAGGALRWSNAQPPASHDLKT